MESFQIEMSFRNTSKGLEMYRLDELKIK